MRQFGLVLGLITIAFGYADAMISSENYLDATATPITTESLKLQNSVNVGLPAKSQATVGQVFLHSMDFGGFTDPIFIIGDDSKSRDWLKGHVEELRQINAIGFVTNIESNDAFEALQAQAGTPLLPANVDDLLLVLKANHYPLIAHQGEVWQ